MEIDENIFSDISKYIYSHESVYILHNNDSHRKIISYGKIGDINKNNFQHFCDTDKYSGGAPILAIDTQKVIGIHIGSGMKFLNFGTFFKLPIAQFIDLNKDFIKLNGLSYYHFSLSNFIYTVNRVQNINSNDIQNHGAERIEELEEKIKVLNDLLTDRINKANSIITKNTKTIDELKTKLSRFPVELLEGEKLMSIIVTTLCLL